MGVYRHCIDPICCYHQLFILYVWLRLTTCIEQGWSCQGLGNPQFMSTDASILSENRL